MWHLVVKTSPSLLMVIRKMFVTMSVIDKWFASNCLVESAILLIATNRLKINVSLQVLCGIYILIKNKVCVGSSTILESAFGSDWLVAAMQTVYFHNAWSLFNHNCIASTKDIIWVVNVSLAEKFADMLATCRPDSQMSALLAEMPLSRRHNFDPDTFFCVGICRHPPNFPL